MPSRVTKLLSYKGMELKTEQSPAGHHCTRGQALRVVLESQTWQVQGPQSRLFLTRVPTPAGRTHGVR